MTTEGKAIKITVRWSLCVMFGRPSDNQMTLLELDQESCLEKGQV